MNKLTLIVFTLISTFACSAMSKVSYDEALAKAQHNGTKVLLLFIGSDWCSVCGRMEKNVISTPEFAQAVAGKFEVVTLDYPQVDKQSDAVKKQNALLADKYKIKSFPTIIVINDKQQHLFRQDGYKNESVAEFIKKIEQ